MTNLPAETDQRPETYSVAAWLCVAGLLLRMALSPPVLNMFGIGYGGGEGSLLGKIHPGSYLILLSFPVLLASTGNPIAFLIRMLREETAYLAFLVVYLLATAFWIFRDPAGVGSLFDVHLVLPISLLILSVASASLCRKFFFILLAFACLNSVVGLFEAATHIRLIATNPNWEVAQQDYFRASAFAGHPLTNAAFTSVMIFALLGASVRQPHKTIAFIVLLLSLIAFGGRAALVFSLVGLAGFGAVAAWRHFNNRGATVLHILLGALAVLTIPLIVTGLLYAVLQTGIGERLQAYNSLQDSSAAIRATAWDVFNYLTPTDYIMGCTSNRVMQLIDIVGVPPITSDLENPWVLMFLNFGLVFFSAWFLALLITARRTLRGASLPFVLCLVSYFAIASTSNSFARQDAIYTTVFCLILCAVRGRVSEEAKDI